MARVGVDRFLKSGEVRRFTDEALIGRLAPPPRLDGTLMERYL